MDISKLGSHRGWCGRAGGWDVGFPIDEARFKHKEFRNAECWDFVPPSRCACSQRRRPPHRENVFKDISRASPPAVLQGAACCHAGSSCPRGRCLQLRRGRASAWAEGAVRGVCHDGRICAPGERCVGSFFRRGGLDEACNDREVLPTVLCLRRRRPGTVLADRTRKGGSTASRRAQACWRRLSVVARGLFAYPSLDTMVRRRLR